MTSINFKTTSINEWIDISNIEEENLEARCTIEFAESAIREFDNISVKNVEIVEKNEKTPKHFHVILNELTYGNHPVEINVWLPFQWNERYLGCLGGGTRTFHLYEVLGRQNRITLPFVALKNGFATANTDGGVPGQVFTWGFNEETKETDFELIENFGFRSAYSMTLAAKKLIREFYGREAAYSYIQGASGGGRMAMKEAQLHPEEYDGIWAVDPAINWSELFATFMWPQTVMNEEKHVVSYAKMEAFYKKSIEMAEGDYGFNLTLKPADITPDILIGEIIDGDEFTAEDARVLKLILQGNSDLAGNPVWFGYMPETHYFADNPLTNRGVIQVQKDENGNDYPELNTLVDCVLAWVTRKKKTEVSELTYEYFDYIRKAMKQELGCLETNDPDLIKAKKAGTKILLTHAFADDTIPSGGTIHYYNDVLSYMGGEENTEDFFRCFITPGGGHTDLISAGLSTTLSGGMTALMKWVEENNAVEELPGITYDFDDDTEVLSGTVRRYHPGMTDVVVDIQKNEEYFRNRAAEVNSKYGKNSIVSDLLENDETSAIVKKYIGALIENPVMAQAFGLSLQKLKEIIPMDTMKQAIQNLIEELEKL